MKKNTFLLTTVLLFLLIGSSCTKTEEKKNCIIGYVYGAYGINLDELDVTKFTHINYSFGNIIDGKIKCEFPNDLSNIQKILKLRDKHNKSMKLMLSVGGWTWSGNFSDMSLTEKSRSIFIQSSLDFIDKTNIDGIDLDWEYPGQIGMNNKFRSVDKQNFTLLLKELREALDKKAIKENRADKYLLTIAAGAGQSYIDNTEMHLCSKYLDMVNLMTYDFYTEADSFSGHHANLYNSKYDSKGISVDTAVKLFLNAGVPKEKLVVGIPFYSRTWGGIKANKQNGQYVKSTSKLKYNREEIEKLISEGKLPVYRDEETKAAYRWSESLGIFMSIEDSLSVAIKAKYIKDNNLKGAMYWAFSKKSKKLLDALNKGIHK